MAVAVKGGLDGGMAKLGLNEFEVLALIDQQAGEGVAQIVKTYLPQPGPLQSRVEYALNHVIRVHRTAGTVGNLTIILGDDLNGGIPANPGYQAGTKTVFGTNKKGANIVTY